MHAIISNLHWQSDFNGEDYGYDDINVIGVYTAHKLNADLLIDMDTLEVLEIIPHDTGE